LSGENVALDLFTGKLKIKIKKFIIVTPEIDSSLLNSKAFIAGVIEEVQPIYTN
jgi:hypothetical protein